MDRTYHSRGIFEFDVDSVALTRLALFSNEGSARVFEERIFPHLVSCAFGSTDRKYPVDHQLKEAFFHRLGTDSEVSLVVFNTEAFHQVPVATKKILFLDQLISSFYSAWNAQADRRIQLDEQKIVNIMRCFYLQWEYALRQGSFSYHIRNSRSFDQASLGWILDLITDGADRTDV